jgi:hypothetical protein
LPPWQFQSTSLRKPDIFALSAMSWTIIESVCANSQNDLGNPTCSFDFVIGMIGKR